MADAGLLSIKMTADDAQLLAALARSKAAIKSNSDQISSGLDVIKSYGKELAALGIAAYIQHTSEAIDTQAKLARQTGGTTAAIQALTRAGDLAGVSTDDLTAAAGKLNVKLGQALEGTGSATGALKALHLTAQQLSGMDTDTRFATIADAIAKAGISAAQTSNILRDLGIKQASIISLFEGGGGAIRDARKEIEGFGVAVSEIDAAKIEAGNDAMTSIGLTVKGVATQIAIQLAPVLQEIGTRFHDAADASGGFRDFVIPALEGIAKALSYVGDSIKGLNMLWLLVKSGAEYMTADVLKAISMIPLAITDYIDSSITEINKLVAAANDVAHTNIPPIKLLADTGPVQAMRGTIELVEEQARATEKQLELMASADLPSDKVDSFFDAVKKRANDAAVAVVAARKTMTDPVVLDTRDPKLKQEQHDKAAAEIESMRVSALSDQAKALGELQEKYTKLNQIIAKNPELQKQAAEASAGLAAQYQQTIDTQISLGQLANKAFLDDMTVRVEAIQTQNDTELEMMMKKYADDQEMLEQALLNGVITEAKYQEISAAQQKAYQDKIQNTKISSWEDLKNLNKLSWQDQLAVTANTLTSITAALSTHSRKAFEINKAASIATAVVKGAEAIQSAWAAGMSVGGPWAPVVAAGYAAAAAVTSAVQIGAIASTQFGGGAKSTSAGTPSAALGGGGGDGAAAGSTPAPIASAHTLKVEEINPEGFFSGKTMRAFAQQLLDFQRDGGQVLLT